MTQPSAVSSAGAAAGTGLTTIGRTSGAGQRESLMRQHGRASHARKPACAALALAAAFIAGCSGANSGVTVQTVPTTTNLPVTATTTASETGSENVTTGIPNSTAPSTGATTSGMASRASSPRSASTSPHPRSSGARQWPADFTPAQQDSAKAAIAAFDGFTRVSADAQARPALKDWTKDIRKYAADPTAAQTLHNLATLVSAKVHAVVSSTYETTSVKSADGHKVVVQSCVDSSKASIADSSGHIVKLRPDQHPRTLLTFNVYLYAAKDGGWLVGETIVPDPAKIC